MIIVQAPLRISFFGGGTDFPSYYLGEGGCVLSSAIDKFIFVTIKKRFDQKLRVGYTRTEIVDTVDEIQHELIREAFRKTGIIQGVEITTMGDIPASGSGLGSSSAVTVGALLTMHTYLGESITIDQLANEACEIEIDILKKPIGIQDQYISAFGGLRFFDFQSNGKISSERLPIEPVLLQHLNENLLLFFTGITRQADTILNEQKQNIPLNRSILDEMKCITYRARDELCAGNLDQLGYLLHESWLLKKQLTSKVSNGTIDLIYNTAREAGAIGGKITGAGGGGFLLLYCPYAKRDAVRNALQPLQELPFKLELDGAKVIFNYRR
jgi:D-glycero-alpha-D-manno-heptose-7-phosphate kinase